MTGVALRHLILLQAALIVAVASCTAVSVLEPPGFEPTPTPAPPPDRTDCGQILDSVFRSDNERTWFADNCSSWPEREDTRVTAAQASLQAGTRPPEPTPRREPQECATVRGQPYASSEQRAWFLANCLGSPPADTARPPQPQPGAPDQVRGDCRAIFGTPYLSLAERDWFRANCLGAR